MGYYDHLEDKDKKPNIQIPVGKIELVVPDVAWRKIINYAKAAGNMEISGFADITYNKETQEVLVGKVYLIEQTVGGATVHMDEEDVSKFQLDLVKKGVKQLPQLWWHSHVDMDAFFSAQDQETSENLQNDSFSVSLVVNKRGEAHARMYIHADMTVIAMGETHKQETWISVDDLPIRTNNESDIPKDIMEEVKEKIHTYKVTAPWGGGWLGRKKKQEDGEEDEAEKEESLEKGSAKKHTKDEIDETSFEDMHDGYTKDPDVKVYRLPKEKKEAIEKIEALDLIRDYNILSGEYVWIPKAGSQTDPQVMFVDWWEVLKGWGWDQRRI